MGYGPIKATVGPALEMLYQPWIRGEENIPATGGVILASSHLSYGETVLLPAMIRRRMTFPVTPRATTTVGPWVLAAPARQVPRLEPETHRKARCP